MSDSLRPYGLQIARLLCLWDSSGRNTVFQEYRNTEDPPGGLPDPGIEPEPSVSPTLAGGFFTTELPEWSSTRVSMSCWGHLLGVWVHFWLSQLGKGAPGI